MVEFSYFYAMNRKVLDINISRVLALTGAVNEFSLGSDIVLGEACGERLEKEQDILDALRSPVRLDGYAFFFLRSGHIRLELNLAGYELHDKSVLVTYPGSIIHISDYDKGKVAGTKLYFLIISGEILGKLQLTIDNFSHKSSSVLRNLSIVLSDEDCSISEIYFKLARDILRSGRKHKEDILVPLLSSLTHVVSAAFEIRDSTRESDTRQDAIYESFISLVSKHHVRERGVGYYADRLNLSPKYLSKVIKKVSGRSAPEWIDGFVVLEAKSLLRYSGMSVKEIAAALNFNSQSLFYKFFLSHTGMSPSAYR